MNDFPQYSQYQQAMQQLQNAQQNQNIYNQPAWMQSGQLNQLPNQLTTGFMSGGVFMADGKKPLVVCNGEVVEAKDMDDAQRIAEEKAHQKSANAYILKPVKQIAPKRDVVTTDL